MYWYDGGKLPPKELFEEVTLTVKEQDDGKEVESAAVQERRPDHRRQGHDVRGRRLRRAGHPDRSASRVEVDVEYPRSAGHEKEWFNAMRDPSKPAMSNFPDYAGPLTETILLGNLAVWKRGRVEWDPVNLKPLNDPSLAKIVRTEYRDGYEV